MNKKLQKALNVIGYTALVIMFTLFTAWGGIRWNT